MPLSVDGRLNLVKGGSFNISLLFVYIRGLLNTIQIFY